ncbi:hypothetical protein TSUD_263030 [Trifolium subterraneum]|nr:hypothetical protein TSUD_263030 [Trifolium subterraneum]
MSKTKMPNSSMLGNDGSSNERNSYLITNHLIFTTDAMNVVTKLLSVHIALPFFEDTCHPVIGAAINNCIYIFEKSLQCTFSTLDEYLELFLTRVDGLRRRMAFTKGENPLELEYKIIRETFQK